MISKILTFLFSLSLLLHAQEWSYIGVPYPTDEVPTAIMPTLPDGTGSVQWPYDPCGVPAPTFTGGENQYYVDGATGNNTTAGNGGRGTVELPRATLPLNSGSGSWALPAGTQIFVTEGTLLHSDGFDITTTASGTAENPVWLIGLGTGPIFRTGDFFVRGDHLIIDNFNWIAATNAIKFQIGEGGVDADHIVIRNCEFNGNHLGSGGRMISTRGSSGGGATSNIVLYNNKLHNFGDWDRTDETSSDAHGVQVDLYTSHLWIIDNEIYNCQGDSIQVGNSGYNQGDYAHRPHYIYIAGNTFNDNYEQGVDCKNSYHVIISENLFYNFDIPHVNKPSNGLAILLINNGEGWLAGYHWALFNTIRDSTVGIKMANTQAQELDGSTPPVQVEGSKSYSIGNLIYNIDRWAIQVEVNDASPSGTNPPVRTWGTEAWVVHNTAEMNRQGVNQLNATSSSLRASTLSMIGNVFYGEDNTYEDLSINGVATNIKNLVENVIYRNGGSANIDSGDLTTNTGNVLDSDPLFGNPATGDFTLQETSPAVALVSNKPAPYTTFESLYGIDIYLDRAGNVRPATDSSAGAYEFGSSPPPPDPDPPGSGTATSETVTTGTVNVAP